VSCPEPLRVQAYFDGELDAIGAADVERHRDHCAQCRELLEDLERTRGALRRELSYARVPAALAARLGEALDQEASSAPPARAAVQLPLAAPARAQTRWPARSFWAGAFSGLGLSALAAGLAIFLLLPLRSDPLIDDLVGAHLRSLMPTHLIDVASSDRHTVKPWFAGHADVSPAVADFEQQGYKLVGGRADYLDHQRSAVSVYQHGPHVINVFSWAADRWPAPGERTRQGYHLLFWKSGDLEYCAVSDTGRDELLALAHLIQALSAREGAQ
jgi:anti-sigma factor RsiW